MSTIWIEPDDKPIPEYPLRPSVKAAIAELIARDRTAAAVVEPVKVETAAVVATGTTSQAKPAIGGWDAAFARARGVAPAENTAAVPEQADASGWDKAFAEARQRREAETLELAEGAEQPDAGSVDSWSAALLRARAGGR
jgi:hypothetical protein